jgi:hypothetical protein
VNDEYTQWQIRVYGRGAGGGVTRRRPSSEAVKRIRKIQMGRCLYCELTIGSRVKRNGKTVALTAQWDHFVPYSYLAQNPEANWVLACQVCNGIKSDRIFKTVEEARLVILQARDAKGYELVAETVAKQKQVKARTRKKPAKPRPKPKAKIKAGPKLTLPNIPAPRAPAVRLPPGAVTHGCGAWWTGSRRSHCPSCCQTFATEEAAELHRVSEGGKKRCLSPEDAGLISTPQPWGVCWQKGERWEPTRVPAHRRETPAGRWSYTPEQITLAGDLQARALAIRDASDGDLSISEAVELAAVQIQMEKPRSLPERLQ